MNKQIDQLYNDIRAKRKAHSRRMIAGGVTVVLAAAFGLCLAMGTALTLNEETFCGHEAHAHDEGCIEQVLICGLEEGASSEGHAHGEDCFETRTTLICELEETELVSVASEEADADALSEETGAAGAGAGAGEGGDAGDAGGAGAEDGDGAGTTDEGAGEATEGTLQEEGEDAEESAGTQTPEEPSEPTHFHSDECYLVETVLVCTTPESEPVEGHQHTETCYESQMTCTEDEHEHTLACYSNPNADVESAADWEATLSEVSLTGDWAVDVLAIANSQLGYTESSDNYIVRDDGETTKGYTRYGAWYGDAYGDWCAMFVSFCLHYAGIPTEAMPQHANCQSWIDLLQSDYYDLYEPAGGFEPLAGDLVFFDWNGDGVSDHIGIVTEDVVAESTQLKTIEGNTSSPSQVAYKTYDLHDSTIMGYGTMPINPALETTSTLATTIGADNAYSVPGSLYHAPAHLFYQGTDHKIGASKHSLSTIVTFVLIPKTELGNDLTGANWTPNPSPNKDDIDDDTSDWSADALGANYVVAYCSDKGTSTSSSGMDYTTYILEEARFEDNIKKSLAGVIENAYPFLTEAEMRANLQAAYQDREINTDLTCCEDSEFITAAQWAIWQLTTLTADLSTYDAYHAEDERDTLKANETSHSSDTSHIEEIKNWLLKQNPVGDLAVKSYEYDTSKANDGSFTLTVTATLNRATTEDDAAKGFLESNGKQSNAVSIATGANQFTVSLGGLTEAEVNNAQLRVTGEHMQVYLYEADNNQDLIGGNWEKYHTSFALNEETTEVAVTKSWAGETPGATSVEVTLLADGVPTGNTAVLSSGNNWSHVWHELPKNDLTAGGEIAYTVRETPVEGYITNVTKGEPTSLGTAYVWTETSNIEAGGPYVLMSQNGALGVAPTSTSRLSWRPVDLSNASNTETFSQWTAASSNGGFVLTNASAKNYLTYSSSNKTFKMGNSSSVLKFTNNHISNKDGSRYFTGMNTSGVGESTTSSSSATTFTWYKKSEVQLPSADINYIITNTAIPQVNASVTKSWAGNLPNGQSHPSSVEVTLFQKNSGEDGEGSAYATVSLSSSNNWTHTWTSLPAWDSSGNLLEYYVAEAEVSDYESAVTTSMDEAGNYAFGITNTYSVVYYELPATGGLGMLPYLATGCSIMAAALAIFFFGRRRGDSRN